MKTADVKVADVIRGAIERLGPNGERWSEYGEGDHVSSFCVGVAFNLEIDRLLPAGAPLLPSRAHALIAEEVGCTVGKWNDDPQTTWPDVQLVLKRLLHRAESEGL